MTWCVVQTKPREEARAEFNLKRQGFDAWLPFMERSRRHARKIDTARVPVFPGYLFVEMDMERTNWAPINSTFGVARLLVEGARPSVLPNGFITGLRASLSKDGLVALTLDNIETGAAVRLVSGPFADLTATVLELSSRERVKVLLDVLGRQVTTFVSRRWVAPAA